MNKLFNPKVGICWNSTENKFLYLSEKLYNLGIKFKSLDPELIDMEQPDDDIDILYIHPKDANLIPRYFDIFNNLKWVQGQFAGVDTFIKYKDLFNKRNILLTNAKGAFSPSLGEFVVAYLLYWEKNLGVFKDLQKEKNWKLAPVNMLQGKTMGIVGYGNIGAEVAKRLKFGFNVKIIGLKNSLNNNINDISTSYVDELIDKTQLDYLLSKSDYVCSILPKTVETDGLFNDKTFCKFKKGSIFINIGRGSSVNEDDLIKHLKSQSNLRAACLDVTQIEPLPKDSPLWELSNCYISNHSADFLNDGLNNQKLTIDLFVDIIVSDYLNFGIPKKNIINFELGY